MQINTKALSIVSYIGLSLSLVCLLVTIIFFISFGYATALLNQLHLYTCMCTHDISSHFYRKNLFSAVHNFIHLNLSIALFVGYIVFAVGVELAAKNTVRSYSHNHSNFI